MFDASGEVRVADLAAGRSSWADVDRAVRRILGTQLRFYAGLTSPVPSADVVFRPGHRALAREVAARSAVLLKHDAVDGVPLLQVDDPAPFQE